MLRLEIKGVEDAFDEKTETFVSIPPQILLLEHSLVTLSKWESKWHKPFLNPSQDRTEEESLDYIRCMTLNIDEVNPSVYYALEPKELGLIHDYLEDSMTATWFTERETQKFNREVITAEIIYYWMVSLGIPFECENWHLNRLLTLIRVCNIKNTPPKKMGRRDLLARNASLNAARRKRTGSRG